MNSMQIISHAEAEPLAHTTPGPFDKLDFTLYAKQAEVIAVMRQAQIKQLQANYPQVVTQHNKYTVSHPSALIVNGSVLRFIPCLRFDKFEDSQGYIHHVPMYMVFFYSKDVALQIKLAYG